MSVADVIELSLPFKAEYVSVARLTGSGIANRLGFDFETIEDIKVAIAEVCNKLVQVGSSTASAYKIVFKIEGKKLSIIFDCEDKALKCIFDHSADAFGISLINALMDEAEFCTANEYLFLMSKSLEGETEI